MLVFIVLVCASLYSRVDGGLAPFITACHAADAACHKSSAQKAVAVLAAGVPTLGLQPLDPMHIALVQADQAGLKMEFRGTAVKGLRGCTVLGLKRHSHKVTVDLKCSVTLVGNYTIGGKLLVMPVQGEGRYKIKIFDIIVKVQYEVGEKTVAGDKYWSLQDWKYNSDVQTGAVFRFENLFNGNQQLSDTVHKFANENWKDIFHEVAPPIVKAIAGRIVDEIATFFDRVPSKELTLD